MRGTLFLVEHQSHQATVVEVVARLLSLEPSRFLTAEGALRAVERGPPDILLTDLMLPGRDGLSLIRATKERSPKTCCVLLSSVPPGLSPRAQARFGADAVIVRRGRWGTLLARQVGAIEDEEAARLLELVEQGGAGFDALARELLEHRLSPAREVLALRHLAAAFDPDRVLSVLERMTAGHGELHRVTLDVAVAAGGAGFAVVEAIAQDASVADDVRGRAMRHLAKTFPHHAAMPVLQGNLHDRSPLVRLDAAYAAFESAACAGEDGLDTLRELAEAADLPDDLRIAALERAARDLGRSQVKPLLSLALRSNRPAIVHAASALAMKGDGVDVEALGAEASRGPIADRLRALESLARDFPKDAVLPLLEHFQAAPEPAIRRRAYELAMSRADTGFERTIDRAAAEGRAMQEAVLLGALRLGSAGFAAISAIALLEGAEIEVRCSAIRMLGVRFSPASSAPLLSELASHARFEIAAASLLAAVQLGVPGFAVLKSAQISSPIPAVRELALIHLEEHAPDPVFKPALQRALRDPELEVRCRAVELWMRRLGDEHAPLLERLVRSQQIELQHAGLDGAIALGEGGFTAMAAFAVSPDLPHAVRRRALDALIARFPADEVAPIAAALDEPSAPTEPAPPAAPVVESWEVAITKPSPPATAPAVATAPRSAPKSEQIDLTRARKALEAAVLLGKDGLRAIRMLADSRRCPDEVRIQALRRLAADFPDEEVMPVIEKAIADRSLPVQNAGLGCAMLRKDCRFEPIAALALDPAADGTLRVRAVRFLASRFDREKVKPVLEALFEQPDLRVRWWALESMFTSLKFVHPDRVEEHLINLLTEHESHDVKAAAARALGAFGGEHALQALVRFTGLFADGSVKEAARHAASRIRDRLRA
jgi:DNA-binding NarL/FixJ family response regulator/HEAT repeat protein